MQNLIMQAFGAFGAGLATSLSPCVYPMIPITVGFLGSAGAEGKRGKVIGFFLGQVFAFTALGGIAISLGEILGFSAEIPAVRVATGLLLLLFAYFSLLEKLPAVFYRLSNLGQGKKMANSFWSAVVVGVSSAAIASPCTSPVVGGLLAALAQVEQRVWGIFLMFLFAFGLSFLFLIMGLGIASASQMPRAGMWMRYVHKSSGILLLFGGLYFLAGGFGLL